jgi:uncharacterized protein (DUF58 family)
MVRAESRLHFGFTDAGRMLVRGTVYVALAALVVPAFGVLSVLLAVLLTALTVGFVLRPRVQVSGSLPDRIVAGQTARLTYTLTNVGPSPAYHLRVRFRALPETMEQTGTACAVPRLAPGESAEAIITIRPKRRGHYHLDRPVCESSFPFNLFRFGASQREQESLIVLPAFSLLQMPLRGTSRHVSADGARPAARTGTSPEYAGSRPFLPGDSPRRIDVRAWARLAVPATKEYDYDLDKYAALILDTRAPQMRAKSKSKESKELEAAVSLCASAAFTIHKDCLIDLLLAGPALYQFTSLPRATRLDRIHEVLAGVEAATDGPAEHVWLPVEERFREISEAIFILLRWDGAYRQLVESAERAGCRSTVMVVGESQQDKSSLSTSARAVEPESLETVGTRTVFI